MKKLATILILTLALVAVPTLAILGATGALDLVGQTEETWDEKAVYQLLVDAENLSGMSRYNNQIIAVDGDLALPKEYRGVTITYSSRHPEIISNDGVVTLPDTCWIDSRNQQGQDTTQFDHLNDNWPVVLDVTLTFMGQVRTAKLMLVVAPAEGFTCDKYLG
ncbi:MAG TPA: hypothetical protein P5154_04005 [Candidatus Izemoplasmatales bacterium]|nr:hypothetical protein [Bacillota bacterium]HRY77907.1 hypothetical protein [Candidatus Izemoplasmatales bacterium]